MARWTFGFVLALAVGCGSPERGASAPAPQPASAQLELAIASYWGSAGGSALRSAVFDAEGNLFIAGGTKNAAEWPQTAPPIGPLGNFDVIVAKFDPSGQNLWSIVIGGTGEDYAYVTALGADGNLVVGGRSGPKFPVTAGAYQTSFAGGYGRGPHEPTDGFLLSLTPAGALRWATYIGSSGDDITRGIQVLPDGGIAVSGGNTDRSDLPTTPGAVKAKLGGAKDPWVGLFEPTGASARFLTYVGPSDDADTGDETVRSIGWDGRESLWIAGTTEGTDLAATPDAFQPKRGGGSSAYVAKLSLDGRRMPYFSWLGGSGSENVETEGISDAAGAFFLAGGTSSADFPVTAGASAVGSGGDGWVARIEPDGRLGMAARFGGTGGENFFGPALDAAGNLYASGTTHSSDLPTTVGALQATLAGPSDALLVGFDPKGALAFASYFGGSGVDTGRFAAADRAGRRIVLIGETTSTDLKLRNAAQKKPGAVYFAVFEVQVPGSTEPAAKPVAPGAPAATK